jgi:predicted small metal-binding protein
MKQFACGSVVPGCQAVFLAEEEDDILRQVAEHAAADHQMSVIPVSLVDQVRENIVSVSA